AERESVTDRDKHGAVAASEPQLAWNRALPPPPGGAARSRTSRPATTGASPLGAHLDLRVLPFSTRSRSCAAVSRRPAISNQITNGQPSRQRVQPQPRRPVINVPCMHSGQGKAVVAGAGGVAFAAFAGAA